MIDWVNTKPNYSLKPITKLPLDTSQLNTNSSQGGSQIVANYFTQFPLFSSKYLDFVGWKRLTLINMEKKDLTL